MAATLLPTTSGYRHWVYWSWDWQPLFPVYCSSFINWKSVKSRFCTAEAAAASATPCDFDVSVALKSVQLLGVNNGAVKLYKERVSSRSKSVCVSVRESITTYCSKLLTTSSESEEHLKCIAHIEFKESCRNQQSLKCIAMPLKGSEVVHLSKFKADKGVTKTYF